MDLERSASTVKVQDIESDYSNASSQPQNVKERCELIYEVRTICNMDKVVPNCELLSDKMFDQSPAVGSDQSVLSKSHLANSEFPKYSFNCVSEPHQVTNEKQEHLCNGNVDTFMPETYALKSAMDSSNSSSLEQLNDSSSPKSEETCLPIQHREEPTPGEILPSEFTKSAEDVKRSTRRNSKRKKDSEECCPICGVTVRLHDLESHYIQEVDKLSKISKSLKKPHQEDISKNEVFEQIKNNRENRLTARVAKYSARAKSEVKCPVCSLRMSGTAEEINKHVAFCIQDEDSDEMVVVDGEEDEETESFEEYEFGDQTRIRAISLVPGGYRSLHGNSSNRQLAEEDEDLNVDVDDTLTFGEPQYSELDVIPNVSCAKDMLDLEQLRKSVIMGTNVQPRVLETRKWYEVGDLNEVAKEIFKKTYEGRKSILESDPVVASLKEKIKDLEDQDKNVRCLICMESYTKPVVSTTCWHVHCEECWLMTMGVKKLCPQCNMIVFPSDLRKIYL